MDRNKREIKNYIFMAMGFTVILLIFIFHLLQPINILLNRYNWLVDYINIKYDETRSYMSVIFFGENMESIGLLIDILIVAVIVLIVLMVFLKIYWSVKEVKENVQT